MAQYIQKLAAGDNIETPQQTNNETTTQQETPKIRTIKRGNYDIDLDHYIADLEFNFERWLKSRKLSDQQKTEVRNAYRNLINGYNTGDITPGLGNVSIDTKYGYTNAEEGKFDAYGIAQGFFNEILQKQRIYDPEATKKKETSGLSDFKAGSGKGFTSDFNNWYFGDPEFSDLKSFHVYDNDVIDGKRSIKKRISKFLEYLNDAELRIKNKKLQFKNYTSDDDINKLLGYIQSAREALSDESVDEQDRLSLIRLGFDPDLYFKTSIDYDDSTDSESEEEDPLTTAYKEYQNNQRTDYTNFFNYYNSINQSVLKDSYFTLNNYTSYQNTDWYKLYFEVMTKNVKWKEAWNRQKNDIRNWVKNEGENLINLLTRKSTKFKNELNNIKVGNYSLFNIKNPVETTLRAIEIAAEQNADQNTLSNGSIVVQHNNQKQYVIAYNPYDGKVHKISYKTLLKTDRQYLNALLAQDYGIDIDELTSALAQYNKNGGILKHQLGGDLPGYNKNQFEAEWNNYIEQQRQDELIESGLSEEEYNELKQKEAHGQEEIFSKDYEWTNADKARATAMIADITSLIASFVPGYGTAASGASGLIGTIGTAAADFMDGDSLWDIGKNFAINIGLDVAGMIPFLGTSGKSGKLLKTAIKVAPKLLAASTFLDEGVQQSVKKLMSHPDKITVQDWQNISYALKAATGLGSNAVTGMKRSAMRSAMGKPETVKSVTVKVKGKEKTLTVGKDLTENQYNKILEVRNKGPKAINEVLKSFGKKFKDTKIVTRNNIPVIGNKMVGKGAISETNQQYDFSKLENGIFGNPNDVWSDAGIYRMHLYGPEGSTSFNFWNPYEYANRRKMSARDAVRTARQQRSTERPTTTERPVTTNPSVSNPVVNTDGRSPVIIGNDAVTVAPISNTSKGEPIINIPTWEQILKPKPDIKPVQSARLMLPHYNQNNRLSMVVPGNRRVSQTRIPVSRQLPRVITTPYTRSQRVIVPPYTKPTRSTINLGMYGPSKVVPQSDGSTLVIQSLFKKGGILNRINNITKNAKGGRIQKFAIGGSNNLTVDWTEDIYGNELFKQFLGSLTEKDINDFNNLQKSYAENLKSTQYDNSKPLNWKYGNGAVKNRRKVFNEFHKGFINDIFQQLIDKGWNTKGSSNDNSGVKWMDDFFGKQEFLRHFGDGTMSKDVLNNINAILKDKELEYYLDTNSNMYLLRSLKNQNPSSQPDLENPNSDNPEDPNAPKKEDIRWYFDDSETGKRTWYYSNNPYDQTIYTELKDQSKKEDNPDENGITWTNIPLTLKPKTKIKPEESQEDIPAPNNWYKWLNEGLSTSLGGIDLASILGQINRNEKTLKEGYRPIYHNPLYEFSPIHGDWYTRMTKEQEAADYVRQAKNMVTSDQMWNAATMLDFHKAARKLQGEGLASDNQAWQDSTDKSVQAANNTAKYGITNANENQDRTYTYNQMAAQIEADASAKRQKAFSNAILEARTRINQNIEDYQQFYLNNITRQAQYIYQQRVRDARAIWDDFKKQNEGQSQAWLQSTQEYQNYLQAIADAEMEMQSSINKYTAKLTGWPAYKFQLPFIPTYTPYLY